MTYFTDRGKLLPFTENAEDYKPGDIVDWELTNGAEHVEIVTNIWSNGVDRYLIVHNIGAGTRVEDVMFAWTIKDSYRLF